MSDTADVMAVAGPVGPEGTRGTDPPLQPVLGDGPVHLTACLHPLAVGEDLSLATPRVSDSVIDTRSHRVEEAESA